MADSPPSPCPGRGCWGKGKRTPFLRPVGEISTKCAKTFLYMFLVSLKLIIFGGENGNRFSPGGGFLCMKRKQRRRMPHLTWKHRPLPMSVPTGADSRLMVPLAFGFPIKKWPEYLCIRGIFILSLSLSLSLIYLEADAHARQDTNFPLTDKGTAEDISTSLAPPRHTGMVHPCPYAAASLDVNPIT